MRILSAVSLRFPELGSSAQGQSGPKVRPKGVADGYPVNIPELLCPRYHDGGTQEARSAWIGSARAARLRSVGRSARKIRWVANPEGPKREPSGSQSD